MGFERDNLKGAVRLGVWVGCFAWLIGLVLVTLPDTPAFFGPLVGGAALSAACALGLEALWRNAPRPEFAMLGGAYCVAAFLAAYYGWIIEPSLKAAPGLVARTAGVGAPLEISLQWVAIALVIGAPALLAGLHRRPLPAGK
ncbi:MAG: hypothetical protein JRH01_07240 [Deltaproteobacteria bacterium]|nr:hypothetical protein [Deltaproteobacteria bacterium]MBW2394851.1 hypothetical protein [Deltaproteobacteria bacterium]